MSIKRRAERRRREIAVIIACTLAVLIAGSFSMSVSAAGLKRSDWQYSSAGANIYGIGKEAADFDYSLSSSVIGYEPMIMEYADEYGISEYADVIAAIMQQESKGEGTDVMQCSECYYNTAYPNTPGAITDPEYSVSTGVRYFSDCLEIAGCRSPGDTGRLKLALQGYNFGTKYIYWALERDGGYTKENAEEFSEMMCSELGWDRYGDVSYPDNVLRYYY